MASLFSNRRVRIVIVPLFLLTVAVFLRIWQLPAQVVGDDEYHGIRAALEPMSVILTHFQWADNCIPLTAFYRILIRTVGLSDPGLRALPLLAGLLAVVLCAVFLRCSVGSKASAIGMFLTATSPLLIYYSRYARPYMIVIFLSFVIIQALFSWLEEKRPYSAWFYVLAAVLAAYFSLPALPGLIAPILWLGSLHFVSRLRPGFVRDPRLPQFPTLLAVGGAVLLGIALWFVPAASSMNSLTQKAGLGKISPAAFPVALNLFAGTGNDILSFGLLSICAYGLFRLAKTHGLFAGCLIAMAVLQCLSLAVVRPHAIQAPIVLARYSIILWPIWVIGISNGLADLHDRLVKRIGLRKGMAHQAAVGLLPVSMAVLFFLGPLPSIYRYQNSFTNHNDFQESYDRAQLTRLDGRKDIWPAFYDRLSEDLKAEAVIEYPFVTPWHYNPYHIYQRRHRKKVLIGRDEWTYVVQVLPIMHPDLHLANSIDLTNSKAIRQSKASYILVHKDLLAELLHLWRDEPKRKTALEAIARNSENINQIYYFHPARDSSARILPVLTGFFGPPVYEDEWMVAFKAR